MTDHSASPVTTTFSQLVSGVPTGVRMYKYAAAEWGRAKGYSGRNHLYSIVFVCATGSPDCNLRCHGSAGRENRVTLQQGTLYLLGGCCSHQMEQSIPSPRWAPFSPGDLSRQRLCINGKALQWLKWSCPPSLLPSEQRPQGRHYIGSVSGGDLNTPSLLDSSWTDTTENSSH